MNKKEFIDMIEKLQNFNKIANYYYSLVFGEIKDMIIEGNEVTIDIVGDLSFYKEFIFNFIKFKNYWKYCNEFIEKFKDFYAENTLFNKLENTVDSLLCEYDIYNELYEKDINSIINRAIDIIEMDL